LDLPFNANVSRRRVTRPAEQATRRQNCGYAGFSKLDHERALRIENDLSNWEALMQITPRISIEHGRSWPTATDIAPQSGLESDGIIGSRMTQDGPGACFPAELIFKGRTP
jgi:hypothetical protein